MVEISEAELIRRWVALSHEDREVYNERAMAILREKDKREGQTGSITDGMKEAAFLAQQLWIEDQKRAARKKK